MGIVVIISATMLSILLSVGLCFLLIRLSKGIAERYKAQTEFIKVSTEQKKAYLATYYKKCNKKNNNKVEKE